MAISYCTQGKHIMVAGEEFIAMLQSVVPLPEEMIDAQIRGMREVMYKGGASPSRMSGITLENQGCRNMFQCQLISSLCGFIHSVGEAFCFLEKKKPHVMKGAYFALTAQKIFLPEVSHALLSPHRMWPISQPDEFLAQVYDWYVRGAKTLPHHFRRQEWEFCVDEADELGIRLIGDWEVVPERPTQAKAKVVKQKRGCREKIQGEGSPKK
jgi:hypothetical protein